jgi:hypothetical protein
MQSRRDGIMPQRNLHAGVEKPAEIFLTGPFFLEKPI